ncbi:uncharacterized protein [Palaemon carinicauda]|uniref:uncharacterized protein n=1 Tax=Palaemon carinicauda TaxID=392227 RepID=UPI0035B5DF3A
MFLGKNAKKTHIAAASILAVTLFIHIFCSHVGNIVNTSILKAEPSIPSMKMTTTQSNFAWTDAGFLLPSPSELKRHDDQRSSSSGLSAVFSKQCYRYDNFIASNTCCRLIDYRRNSTNIEKYVKIRSEINAKINVSWDETNSSISSMKTSQEHWVFVGDSHCRYIFVSLIHIFNKHKLRYRFPRQKTLQTYWQDFHTYRQDLKAINFHEDLEILHKEMPLKISFLWDRKLHRLPGLVQEWHTQPAGKPTFVLADTGLYYMIDRAQDEFENFMTKLSKNISNLAATVPVVYKLIDHLQAKDEWFAQQLIDEYNAFAARLLRNTGVIVWDSCLPLSDMYVQECRRHPRNMKKSRHWLCNNKGHTGYIMVDQYANMVLNYISIIISKLAPELAINIAVQPINYTTNFHINVRIKRLPSHTFTTQILDHMRKPAHT